MVPWFFSNTVAATGLALIVLVACRFGRFRPAVEHALWVLVLVKLLTPAWLAWPWSPWNYFGRAVQPDPASQRSVDASVPSTPLTVASAPRATGVISQGSVMLKHNPLKDDPSGQRAVQARRLNGDRRFPTTPSLPSNPEPRTLKPPLTDLWTATLARWFWHVAAVVSRGTLYVWAFGAAVLLALQSIQAIRFRRLAVRGKPVSDGLAQELSRMAGRLGVRPPAVRVVWELASPILWCLGKPTLLWPEGLSEDLAAGATRSLLLHELAHLRRRDHWVAWLEGIGLLIWWWNPLFWYVRRRLRQSAEMACDAWVVWALPDARRTYAESLVTVTELASQGRALVPAWGAIGEARTLERRLTMIFQNDVRRDLPWSGLLLILLLALVVLPGWSWGGEDGEKPQAAAVQEQPPAEPAVSAAEAAPPSAEPAGGKAEPTPVLPPSAAPVSTPSDKPAVKRRPAKAGQKPTAEPITPPAALSAQPPVASGRSGVRGSSSAGLQPMPPGEPPIYHRMGAPAGARYGTPSETHDPFDKMAEQVGPLSIRVFQLKRRDPGEMISMINALWAISSGQTQVVAFVPVNAQPAVVTPTPAPYGTSGMAGAAAAGLAVGVAPTLPNPSSGPSPASTYMPPEAHRSPGYGPASGGSPRLAADRPTQSLIARGSAEQLERVAQIVAALDTPAAPDTSQGNLPEELKKLGSVRPLTPQHRSVREIVPILQGLGIAVREIPIFIPGEKAGAAKSDGALSDGALIAVGPENDVAEIQRLIQSLDVEKTENDSARPPMASPPPLHPQPAAPETTPRKPGDASR